MKKIIILFLLIFNILASVFAQKQDFDKKSEDKYQVQNGNLVIVGGGLKSDNSDVYNKFIELAGGKENAIIAILPTASASPQESLDNFKNNLIKYGVISENIHFIEVATIDDSSTPDIDESKWIKNSNEKKYCEILSKCTGVWFVGGDQMRITKALYNEDGSNSEVLNSIWKIYNNKGVIGGTSAGAAIMSYAMIAAGTSYGALSQGITTDYYGTEQQENGPLFFSTGLGFFNHSVVDQHFDAKARIGRLVVAAINVKDSISLCYGIDENTAIIVYGTENKIEVLGTGSLTIVNTSKAKITKNGEYYNYENIILSNIEGGDIYYYEKNIFEINKIKSLTTGNEYFNIPTPVQSGILVSYPTFKDLITINLIDNSGTKEVVSYSFDSSMTGFKFVFSKYEETLGYWTNEPDGNNHYSAINVLCNIYPVKIKIEDIKQ